MLIAYEYGYYNKQSIQKGEVTVRHKLRTNESLSFLDFGQVVVCLQDIYVKKSGLEKFFKEVSFT